MSSNILKTIIILLFVVFASVLTVFFWQTEKQTKPALVPAPLIEAKPQIQPPETLEPQVQIQPQIEEPQPELLAEIAPEQPAIEPLAKKTFDFELPSLEESDDAIFNQLKTKLTSQAQNLLLNEAVIERVVSAVTAISQNQMPYGLSPIKRPAGSYAVIEIDGLFYYSNSNAARYQPYLDLLDAMPAQQWAEFYLHIYPLLQESYQQLGYGDKQFSLVVQKALTNLLASPTPSTTLPLIRPHVLYEYANKDLQQNTTAIDKLMLRIGATVNNQLKSRLKSLKIELQKADQKINN